MSRHVPPDRPIKPGDDCPAGTPSYYGCTGLLWSTEADRAAIATLGRADGPLLRTDARTRRVRLRRGLGVHGEHRARSHGLLSRGPHAGRGDRFGRSLYYLDRDDGLDVALQMLRAGWDAVRVAGTDLQRIHPYVVAETDASAGLWRRCEGDVHRSLAEERRASAEEFMDLYYARVSVGRFRAAWGMLGRRVRHDFGSFRTWKAGHRRSLGVSLLATSSRLSRGRAVVNVRLRSRDRDACSGSGGRVARAQGVDDAAAD